MMTLDSLLARFAGRGREALLPALWDIQSAAGHINPEAVLALSNVLRVPPTEIYGVIEFYTLFHSEPTGETIVYACGDQTCGAAGADGVADKLCARLGIQAGETSRDGKVTVLRTTCLGLCDRAPSALIAKRGQGEWSCAPLTGDETDFAARALGGTTGATHAELLRGLVPERPQTLAEYGDYGALRHAVLEMTPETLIQSVADSNLEMKPGMVVRSIKDAKLIGRGGAAFPTGVKWEMTRQAAGQPHYLVCNADESEPGTFKDRLLMESRPHLLLEGMALAGYAVGANKGYLFIRGEYPEATRIMQAALDEANAAGMLSIGTFRFEVEIRRGGGAYICGEETALFEAIEGKRGYPRVKPPYPTTHGLFGKPTTVNNVETLATIPLIVSNGAEWFRRFGTEASAGTKLVSVSGHVQRPGVYEISPGLTLRALLDELCGGVVGELQAVLMGGASGTFLTPDELDVRLTFEDLRAAGSTFGSGAVMVFNQDVEMRGVLGRLGHFFAHESCGKCFPCQLGTQRQMEILDRLDAPLLGDFARLRDIAMTMTEASLCGLGQTAASAVMSAMRHWPHLFEAVAV